MKAKTASILFAIILALSFLIRLPGIYHTATIDEDGWLSWDYWGNWHPPISILANSFAHWLLGDFSWVSKLLILLVGCINLFLTYLISKKLFGQKAAIFTAGLMGIGAYSTLAALQIDIDGSFLMLGFLMTTLFFLKYEIKEEKKWLALSGLGVGFCLLTKYPGVFILPILAFYYLIRRRNFWSTVKTFFWLLIIGAAVFSIFPLACYFTHSSFFTDTLAHLTKYTLVRGIDPPLLLVQYLLSVIWIGPLFIGLLVLSFAKPKKGILLPYLWIAVILLAYTFLNRDNFKPIERYFAILVAPLSMIGGIYLSNLKFKNSQWIIVGAVTLIITFLFGLLNLTGEFLPFYPKTSFFDKALSGAWNFYLPITGSSSPIGFFLNFRILAISFISAAICLLALLIYRNKSQKWFISLSIVLFLSVSLAYNIFLVQEYLFSTTSPSVDKVSKEIITYTHTHELKEPVYIFRNKALRYYERDLFIPTILDFDIENNSTKVNEVISESGTVIIVDFPKLNENSLFWRRIMRCDHVAEFSDKNVKLGYILDCSNLKNEVVVG